MVFRYIVRKLFFIKNKYSPHDKDGQEEVSKEETQPPLNTSKDINVANFKSILSNSSDLKNYDFSFGDNNQLKATLFYFEAMVDLPTILQGILKPLQQWRSTMQSEKSSDNPKVIDKSKLANLILKNGIHTPDARSANSLSELVDSCLNGDTILFVDGLAEGFIIGTKGWETRAITEPESETVVRGPREGFVESFRVNTSLIRRKIQSEKLKIEELTVGRKTKTKVALVYLDGVVDPTVLKKVRYRIGELKVDSILESGYIEEYIEDSPFSPFATVGYTEKPDVVAGKVLEGRVAIVVDGTPFVLTVPYLFLEGFQSAEDYYNRFFYASLVRLLRIFGYFVSVFAPAVYIALTTFHQELIPTQLLFTIIDAREGTPFPAFFEALILIFAYEFLREAGIRLPQAVGQAISIVGALIMGEAAVQAGIVGAPMVIVVAATAVAGFMVPTQNDSISILRVLMMFFAAFAGFFGLAMGFILVITHLASLTSLGVPFLLANYNMQDVYTRAPLWAMQKRPKDIARGDMTRREFFVPPKRPINKSDKKIANKTLGKSSSERNK